MRIYKTTKKKNVFGYSLKFLFCLVFFFFKLLIDFIERLEVEYVFIAILLKCKYLILKK